MSHDNGRQHYSIDVILPFHRIDHFLAESIENLKNAKGVDLRIIAVNDSNKKVDKKQLKLREQDVLISNLGKGAKAALSLGVNISTAQYIGFQDSDDYSHLNRFERQIDKLLDTNSEIVSCGILKFRSKLIKIPDPFGPLPDTKNPRDLLILGAHGADATIVGDREVIQKYWNQKNEFAQMIDYGWLLKINREIRVTRIKKKMYFYRTHKKQFSRTINIENEWEILFNYWVENLFACIPKLKTGNKSELKKIGMVLAFPTINIKLSKVEKKNFNDLIYTVLEHYRLENPDKYQNWKSVLTKRKFLATGRVKFSEIPYFLDFAVKSLAAILLGQKRR